MKTKILYLLLFALSYSANAQSVNGDIDTVILQEADKMGMAFINKDYAAFAKYTHPSIIIMMGGEEKMLSEITRSFTAFEQEGVIFKNVSFGSPSKIIVTEKNEFQCTIPQMIEMKVNGGTLTANTTLIAVSRDNGKNWYFADATGNDITTMRKLIPTLSPKLVIEKSPEPSFQEDKKEISDD